MQLDIVSVLDPHPDPIYASGPSYSRGWPNPGAVIKKWDPHQEVMSLPMYEQDAKVVLRHQRPVRLTGVDAEREAGLAGLDERWGSASFREGG